MLVRAEVFVADVAPADDGSRIVGGQRLVVHAVVQAPEVGEVAQHAEGSLPEWVVEPHLEVGVRSKCEKGRIEAGDSIVVQQETHPHAPRRGAPQRLEQEDTGNVVMPDVVLDVERALGRLDQKCPRSESAAAAGERVNSRQLRVCGHAGTDRLGELAVGSVLDHVGHRAALGWWHAPATAQGSGHRRDERSEQVV